MEYLIIATISLILTGGFLLAFRIGLSLGHTVSRGELRPLKSPIKALKEVKESKEAEKEADKQEAEMDFVLGYTKERAYEEMKKANGYE